MKKGHHQFSLCCVWTLLASASTVFGANYIPWQNYYDLWMPQIVTESRPDPAKQLKLPFAAPVITPSAALPMVIAPVELQSALLFNQPWFSHEIEAPSGRLYLQVGTNPPSEIQDPSIQGQPSSVWCVKTLTDSFVFASWPAEMTSENRRAEVASIKKIVQDFLPGNYELFIYRQ